MSDQVLYCKHSGKSVHQILSSIPYEYKLYCFFKCKNMQNTFFILRKTGTVRVARRVCQIEGERYSWGKHLEVLTMFLLKEDDGN